MSGLPIAPTSITESSRYYQDGIGTTLDAESEAEIDRRSEHWLQPEILKTLAGSLTWERSTIAGHVLERLLAARTTESRRGVNPTLNPTAAGR